VILGTKGNLLLGSNQVVPEMHGDPVNSIPRFVGHPTGGPVYNDTKPEPWIEAQAGTGGRGGGRGPAAGAGGESLEDQMFNANKRDWIECMKSRKQPLCNLEMGHRTAIICNLGNMSLRLGGRTIQWDPDKELVIGDKEAQAMCTKQYRAPWDGILRSLIKV
jgi:Oxidoreductase family, C-terminal alpha/beta domain